MSHNLVISMFNIEKFGIGWGDSHVITVGEGVVE